MTPLGKVSLESFRSFVSEIAADFAVVADVQSVQLVQPVRDGLQEEIQEAIALVIHWFFSLKFPMKTQQFDKKMKKN